MIIMAFLEYFEELVHGKLYHRHEHVINSRVIYSCRFYYGFRVQKSIY